MRRLWIGALVASVLTSLLAGCGGNGDSGLSDYIEAANGICEEMDSEATPFNDALFAEGPPTAERLQTWAGQMLPILDDGMTRLIALDPPESKRSQVAELNQQAEHGLELIQQVARDRAAADRALQSQTDGFEGFREQADELGLDKCVGDDNPGRG